MSLRSRLTPLFFICVLVAVASQSVLAQTTGEIRGLVRDESNPPMGVPDAVVTIVNLNTGLTDRRRTNQAGEYFFDFVSPWVYEISAQCDGYEQTFESKVTKFEVNFNKTNTPNPPPLRLRKIGTPQPATSPTPVAASSVNRLVNLEDAVRSMNFSIRVLMALPLPSSRTFDQLAPLAAGVAPPPQAIGNTTGPGVGAGVGTSGQFAVNGLRSRANNFTVDGSDNNDEDIGVRRQGFTALVPQSIESLQGFQIITLLPRPQFGRNLGAQVNAISRSGGKEFHGALYGFFTDSRLKARDAFDLTNGKDDVLRRSDGAPVKLLDSSGKPQTISLPDPVKSKDPFTRGQYGFVIGGPVIKERTFFFASFEHQDLNAAKESNFAVPTVAERGLFGSGETGLRVRAGNQLREVFPTSVAGDAYFSLFPFPNNPRGPYGANTYTEQLPAGADGTIFSLKLDQKLKAFGKEHSLTGRYNFTDDATTLPVTGEALFSTLRPRVRTQNLSLFLTSTPTLRLSNEARFSYGRTRLNFDEVRDPALLPSKLSNVPFLLNARKLANSTFPSDGVTTYEPRPIGTEADTEPIGQVIVSGYSPIGVDVFNFPQRRVNNTFQIADTAIYSLTRHRLIGGVDFRRTQLNSRLDRNFRSVAYFSGSLDVSAQLGVRNTLTPNQTGFYTGADFVAAGAATGFFQTQAQTPDSTIGLRYWQENFFFADQIRLGKSFKLTFGLRYELNTVPTEVNRRIETTFDAPETRKLIDAEKRLFGVSGFERYLASRQSIFRGDHNNFAPHIAFAWDPFGTGKTAVRGGYSIYYDQIPGAVISQSRSVFPRFLTINLAGFSQSGVDLIPFNPVRLSIPGTLNTFNFGTNTFRGKDFTDVLVTLAQFANLSPASVNYFPAGPGFVLPAADLVTPYAQHWGLTVEREARRDLLVSLAYVGTKGTHLLRFAIPNLGPNAIPVITGGQLLGDNIAFTGFLSSPGQGLSFRRPFPLLGSFTSIESDANSIYHSLQAEAALRLAHGVEFTVAYTWSHAIDEVSDLFELAGARGLPQNSFNRRAERGDANFDVRHRFVQSFVWDLPIWTQSKLLGGWQLAGIITLQTGQPFTVISSVDVNLDGNLTDRLNTLAGVREVNRGSLRFEFPASQVEQFKLLAPAGADGVIGRNTFRAPGLAVVDLAVNKLFRFSDRQELELRTEFFNLFNRTHFGIPVHQLFAPGLGRSVNTTVPARTVQFAVRYKF